MPLLCLECDSRVEPSATKPGIFWCPGCNKEYTRDGGYSVGKRFFASDVGAMLAMAAAMSMSGGMLPKGTGSITKPEATNTFMEIGRQKRKKLHGLKQKQRRHMRQMGGK